jgi:hypothetical protein
VRINLLNYCFLHFYCVTLAAGITRPFLLFVTEEVFLGQLFDAYIFRMKKKEIF